MQSNRSVLFATLLSLVTAGSAAAQDQLKIAVAQRGGWSTAVTELGDKAGFFKKRGLTLDILYADGSGEALQALISGSVDIAVALGFGQSMGAFSKGAPIRVIGGAFTGANDILWYVPSSSPIKSLTDINGQTIGYGATFSSVYIATISAVQEFKINAKLVLSGNYTTTLTQVMSGQLDVGWMAPPVGLQAEEDGKIRIIGSGDQLAKFKDQTVRVLATNVRTLEQRKDVVARYVQGYRDTLDWLYTGTDGVKLFAQVMNHTEKLALRTRDQYFPKDRMSPDRVSGMDGIMADAVLYKVLAAPLTADQLKTLVQVPPPIK